MFELLKRLFDYFRIVGEFRKKPLVSICSDTEEPVEKIGKELENRERLYTKLLADYAKLTKARNVCKEIHKWVFFWLIVASGVAVVIFSGKLMLRVLEIKEIDKLVQAVPIIITALVSLFSAVIGIPITVTKFLFNQKEDENITKTISHTQKHDLYEVGLLKDRYKTRSASDFKPEEFDPDEENDSFVEAVDSDEDVH